MTKKPIRTSTVLSGVSVLLENARRGYRSNNSEMIERSSHGKKTKHEDIFNFLREDDLELSIEQELCKNTSNRRSKIKDDISDSEFSALLRNELQHCNMVKDNNVNDNLIDQPLSTLILKHNNINLPYHTKKGKDNFLPKYNLKTSNFTTNTHNDDEKSDSIIDVTSLEKDLGKLSCGIDKEDGIKIATYTYKKVYNLKRQHLDKKEAHLLAKQAAKRTYQSVVTSCSKPKCCCEMHSHNKNVSVFTEIAKNAGKEAAKCTFKRVYPCAASQYGPCQGHLVAKEKAKKAYNMAYKSTMCKLTSCAPTTCRSVCPSSIETKAKLLATQAAKKAAEETYKSMYFQMYNKLNCSSCSPCNMSMPYCPGSQPCSPTNVLLVQRPCSGTTPPCGSDECGTSGVQTLGDCQSDHYLGCEAALCSPEHCGSDCCCNYHEDHPSYCTCYWH